MRRSITGIDHGVVLVRDLDAASARYQRLGFTVAPRGMHPPELGTGNHTVMLEREYIELMGVVAPTAANERWRRALERGEGLAALALQTPSADAVVAEMGVAGVALDAPVDFARQVVLPDGTRTQAAFRTAQFPKGVAPGFHLFCCEHRTRHITWRPDLLRHANGATGLEQVLAASTAPAMDAQRVAALFAREAVADGEGAFVVDIGNSTIRFQTATALADRFEGIGGAGVRDSGLAALVLRTSSTAAAQAALDRGGVRHVRTRHGVAVAPGDGCGVLLVFRET